MDAEQELEKIREHRQATRRRRRGLKKTRLRTHRAELVQLRRAGASLADLELWLRKNKRCKIHRTTIYRNLRDWPESPDYRPA